MKDQPWHMMCKSVAFKLTRHKAFTPFALLLILLQTFNFLIHHSFFESINKLLITPSLTCVIIQSSDQWQRSVSCPVVVIIEHWRCRWRGMVDVCAHRKVAWQSAACRNGKMFAEFQCDNTLMIHPNSVETRRCLSRWYLLSPSPRLSHSLSSTLTNILSFMLTPLLQSQDTMKPCLTPP